MSDEAIQKFEGIVDAWQCFESKALTSLEAVPLPIRTLFKTVVRSSFHAGALAGISLAVDRTSNSLTQIDAAYRLSKLAQEISDQDDANLDASEKIITAIFGDQPPKE